MKTKVIVATEKESSVTIRLTPHEIGRLVALIPNDSLVEFTQGVEAEKLNYPPVRRMNIDLAINNAQHIRDHVEAVKDALVSDIPDATEEEIEELTSFLTNNSYKKEQWELDGSGIISQRDDKYGGFENVARITSQLDAVVAPYREKLTEVHFEALHMIFQKIARMVCGDPNYLDNPVDIAGYATLLANYLEEHQ